MKPYFGTLVFYSTSAAIIYAINKLSPGQQDGGLGCGSVVLLLVVVSVLVLLIFNAFKGFKTNKTYFIVAGIHLLMLVLILFLFFL
ncbi:MAG: hypothetical protein ACKOWL_07870 [Sphingobacteriaceae bacterium]